jgi:DNA topoisomerase-3
MSLKYPNSGILSVGRVQTPTLAILVQREREILSFKSKPFYVVSALFQKKSGETYRGEHQKKRFETRPEAESVLRDINGKDGTVTDVASKTAYKEAPLLYSLSALQMDANELYGLTADQTLTAAQKLYDGGFTTYPRTDTQYLTEDMEQVVDRVLDMLGKTPEFGGFVKGRSRKIEKKRYFDDSKVNSHFAIIPTEQTPRGLSGHTEKLYGLIARSVVRMIYPAAKIEKTTVITEVSGHNFVSNGTVIIDPGWLAVGGKLKEETLPPLSENEKVSGEYELKEGKTEPPKRYTDKTLIAAMKTAGKELTDAELKKILADPSVQGIGTEATRANIIKTLELRDYIERNGKNIVPTERGIMLIDALPVPDLKSPELTAKWEKRMSLIEKKKDTFEDFMSGIGKLTGEWCGMIGSAVSIPSPSSPSGVSVPKPGSGGCPVCGKPVRKLAWGWSCSGYTEGCVFKFGNTICKKKLTDRQAGDLIEKGETPLIKGFTSKAGKKFDAKLRIVSGKIEFVFEDRRK